MVPANGTPAIAEASLVNAAKLIHQLGPKYVIIKKGEHGALLFHHNEIFSAPALPIANVLDPTGAGDSFAGGFAGYLTQTLDFSFNNMGIFLKSSITLSIKFIACPKSAALL